MENKKWLFKKPDGTTEEVCAERWSWAVIYNDGTELKQFGQDGRFHRVGEIDQDKIEMAVLYKLDDEAKRIDIPWKPGMKLIHKYRNITFDYMSAEKRSVKVYIFGYKDGDHHSFIFVLPDDRFVFSPDIETDITRHNI